MELPEDIDSLLELSKAGNRTATLHCAFYYESISDIPNANHYYELAADSGLPDAQFLLGYRLEHGINVPIDLPRANKYYKLSADNGNGDAQFRLAKNLREGNGIEKDEAEADRYMKMAHESHDRITNKEESLPSDIESLKRLADDQKNAKAMLLVAFDFESNNDIDNANKYYRMSAEAGNADAQFLMGIRLENGINIEKNEDEALKFYRQSAQNGNLDAKARLAQLGIVEDNDDTKMYTDLPDDLETLLTMAEGGNHFAGLRAALLLDAQDRVEEANKMFVKSATAGNPGAQVILGMRLEYGINIEPDIDRANEWYARAALAGNSDAMYRYALNLQNGKGIEMNLAEANMWFKKSADMGNKDAQVAFAMNLQTGNGIDVDEAEAQRYIQLAKGA